MDPGFSFRSGRGSFMGERKADEEAGSEIEVTWPFGSVTVEAVWSVGQFLLVSFVVPSFFFFSFPLTSSESSLFLLFGFFHLNFLFPSSALPSSFPSFPNLIYSFFFLIHFLFLLLSF